MSATNPQKQFPVVCPKCVQSQGYPFQVRTLNEQPGAVEVRLRCRDCTHEWVEVMISRE